MDRDYRDYLVDIREEVKRIREFIGALTFEEFKRDTKTVYAVIRSFEIIGEAVKKLPDDVKAANPDIPWKRIAGMRDKLIHEYFGVSVSILWETVKNRIPELEKAVDKLADRML